ncbi:putative F-box protein At1g49610 isoform X2 [Salvia hispanica]|uniref:putative F-box protein At1g49610 isoform X2 n=1 Tax=Salvia hispanica TaxID=49212 RepID=UPI002009A5B6|nr:putative F-box protein At1g49610 isoform X2 [Salvia hispanica]
MENPKRCIHEDLLRDLPDCLLFDIFWRLPMTDVVRTSVLSKRWRNFWTTAPFLNFDNRAMLLGDGSKLQNFVNQALSCWNGDRVLKFRFHSYHEIASSMYSDVDLWVNFAQRNGVEELHLHVLCITKRAWPGFDGKEVYRVPPCLYSYSSLKELSLQSCNLEISGNVQWNKLESLKINAYTAAPAVINQILSGTPQLKVFHLTYVDKGGILSIQSSSLKELSIDKYILWRDDLLALSDLRICTPNLETLEIKGLPYRKYFLTDVSSLTRAVLDSVPFGLGHFLQIWLSHALSQILQSIQHAENIALSDCCTEVVGALKMNCVHSAFLNVKSLELRCCFDDYKQVVGVLAMFPRLEKLIIRDKKEEGLQDDTEPLKFEANIPESFLLQLRTIEVITSFCRTFSFKYQWQQYVSLGREVLGSLFLHSTCCAVSIIGSFCSCILLVLYVYSAQ